jgi:hypothetical protein
VALVVVYHVVISVLLLELVITATYEGAGFLKPTGIPSGTWLEELT